MYVEISGRQTGKTTRLVDHASDELINNIHDSHYRIGIVGHNTRSSEHIRDLIIERFLTKINEMNHDYYRGILHRLEHENPNGCAVSSLMRKIVIKRDMDQLVGYGSISKFYVDEFAFRDTMDSPLRLLGNAYYCTTPNSNDDFTNGLINYCNEYWVEITSYDVSNELRNEFFATEYIDEFDNYCTTRGIYPMPHPFEESNLLNVKGLFRFNTIKKHKF
jgi:hypothetical protein